MRYLVGLELVFALLAGGAWFVAGRMGGPSIEFKRPEKFVGTSAPLELAIGSPVTGVSSLTIAVEQNGKTFPVYSLGEAGAEIKEQGAEAFRLTKTIGRENLPELKSGPARIVARASRPVLYGLRTVESTAARDVQVRLERPRVAVVSSHHFVNHGGAEAVVYRVSPPEAASGVLVGDIEYPGFAAKDAGAPGVTITDPALRVAFFALRHDQDLKTPIRVFARDEAGNTGRADFDYRVFPKPFKKSSIPLEDKFLEKVVPSILEGTRDVNPSGDNLQKFLVINGELRRKNNEKIASFADQTAPAMLWGGQVFYAFKNTGVQSAFADHRTYVYKGKEVDRQVHLGFDLAEVSNSPIRASNRGKVLFADELGIYGNTVIIDHGLGVQSLYAHLSSIDVKPGDTVQKEQQIGRSGMTGMAAGDHLHFTMLIDGQMVNPVEWWDAHWIEDRILRKLRDAGAPAGTATR
jgi:murein DD-endopeptidase MepM/ murein hydrolase activator NlpD